jgi:hypothetical protein
MNSRPLRRLDFSRGLQAVRIGPLAAGVRLVAVSVVAVNVVPFERARDGAFRRVLVGHADAACANLVGTFPGGTQR